MEIRKIDGTFSVCKVLDYSQVNLDAEYCFIGRTDKERSLVCLTGDVPDNVLEREDNWTAFRIEGALDFSLVGILANISGALAQEGIPIFAISTYNTDYVLVKKEHEMKAMSKLAQSGYQVKTGDPYGDYFLNRSARDIMAEYSEQSDEWRTLK